LFPKRRTNSRELYQLCGRDSSVRTVTGYGLDGPGIESRRGRDFPHLSSPALGTTQLPVQWVPSLSRGKERPGRDADPSPTSSAVFKKVYSYTSHSSYRPYGLYRISVPVQLCGRDSSVRTVTGYGLDGPGIESRQGRDFPHLSSPALGPTQLPVQWVPSLSRGKERPGRDADPSPTSSAVFKKEYSYTSHSSYRPYGLYRISVPVQVYTLHINCGGKGTYGIVQDSLLREAFQHTHTHIHTSCRGLR